MSKNPELETEIFSQNKKQKKIMEGFFKNSSSFVHKIRENVLIQPKTDTYNEKKATPKSFWISLGINIGELKRTYLFYPISPYNVEMLKFEIL